MGDLAPLAVTTPLFGDAFPLTLNDAMCRAIDVTGALRLLEGAGHCARFAYPECAGVYVFDDVVLDRVLYVGESINLRRRLIRHERKYLACAAGVRLRVIPCTNRKDVERWLVGLLRPLLNGISEKRKRRVDLELTALLGVSRWADRRI